MEKFEVFYGRLKKYHGNESRVVLEEGVTEIGPYAFHGNEEIKEVVLPEGLQSIGDYAFYGCKNLKRIEHLEEVKDLGAGVFSCCYALEEIQLPSSLSYLSKSMFYKCMNLKEVTLPKTLRVIENRAFAFCSSLESITLPDTVSQLEDSVFEECINLRSIKLSDALTSIGNKTFFHTPALREIKLSSLTRKIGEAALQTHGEVTIISNDEIMITPQMLDYNYNLNWNYSFKFKNGENYRLVNSYLPCLELEEFKPQTKVIFLMNFLETYDQHKHPEKYLGWCEKYYDTLLDFLIREKRYNALNTGLDHDIIHSQDITQYLSLITDKEERVKLMEYQSNHKDDSIDELEKALLDLF